MQSAGDIVLVPNTWYHATLSLANFTAGIGGQDHPRNVDMFPYAAETVSYNDHYEAQDWKGALNAYRHIDRPGDVGLSVRRVLMNLRSHDLDSAWAVYSELRRDVVEGIRSGLLFQSDADFLFGEVVAAIVHEAWEAEYRRNRQRLTPAAEHLKAWMLELFAPINTTTTDQQYAGGTNVLLHGECRDHNYMDQYQHECRDYSAAPYLCFRVAKCANKNDRRAEHPLCDRLTGKSHRESCCACGGGRRFVDHRRNNESVTMKHMQLRA